MHFLNVKQQWHSACFIYINSRHSNILNDLKVCALVGQAYSSDCQLPACGPDRAHQSSRSGPQNINEFTAEGAACWALKIIFPFVLLKCAEQSFLTDFKMRWKKRELVRLFSKYSEHIYS